jgi:hypothetical protein
LQSSNFQLTPIEPKRGWKAGAAVIGLLSVGAGVGVATAGAGVGVVIGAVSILFSVKSFK